MKSNYLIITFCLTLLTFNCSYDSENDLIDIPAEEEQEEDPISTINYNDDIKPIIDSSCIGCHSNPPVNGAPFSLVNYNQVSQRSAGILNAMSRQSGTPSAMPPSGRLPQTTIDLVEQWIEDGLLEN